MQRHDMLFLVLLVVEDYHITIYVMYISNFGLFPILKLTFDSTPSTTHCIFYMLIFLPLSYLSCIPLLKFIKQQNIAPTAPHRIPLVFSCSDHLCNQAREFAGASIIFGETGCPTNVTLRESCDATESCEGWSEFLNPEGFGEVEKVEKCV